MKYYECPVYTKLTRKVNPLVTKVPIDDFTAMVEKNFDYDFDGISKIYPFELPTLPENFNIMVITGASGSGKSTLIKELGKEYCCIFKKYDDKAIVSNFSTPNEAATKLSAVGLNSLPVWCRPRNVLSTGEGFRADMALNLKSFMVYDEFTSVIDRNVAKSTCNGLQKYIRNNNLNHLVFISCHKDFIPYLKPDLVIDLDEEKMFDCRGCDLGETLPCKSINPKPRICGEFLGNITI